MSPRPLDQTKYFVLSLGRFARSQIHAVGLLLWIHYTLIEMLFLKESTLDLPLAIDMRMSSSFPVSSR